MAAGLGRAAITSLLIAAGADVSIQNQEGETPRMHAEYGNHDEVAKVLREAVEMESVNRDEGRKKKNIKSTVEPVYNSYPWAENQWLQYLERWLL